MFIFGCRFWRSFLGVDFDADAEKCLRDSVTTNWTSGNAPFFGQPGKGAPRARKSWSLNRNAEPFLQVQRFSTRREERVLFSTEPHPAETVAVG